MERHYDARCGMMCCGRGTTWHYVALSGQGAVFVRGAAAAPAAVAPAAAGPGGGHGGTAHGGAAPGGAAPDGAVRDAVARGGPLS